MIHSGGEASLLDLASGLSGQTGDTDETLSSFLGTDCPDPLTDRLDAANAAFQVGYKSPLQFSREYSRQFGAPPQRDISNLRQMAANKRRFATRGNSLRDRIGFCPKLFFRIKPTTNWLFQKILHSKKNPAWLSGRGLVFQGRCKTRMATHAEGRSGQELQLLRPEINSVKVLARIDSSRVS